MKFFIYPFAVAGDKTTIPDTATSDGSISYQIGYTADYTLVYGVDPNAKAVARYSFNELMFDVTTAIRGWQTDAIPPFITSVMNAGSPYPYDQYALVRFDDGSGVQVYWSKVGSNTTDPTNITNWGIFSTDGWQPGDCKDYAGIQFSTTLGRWLPCDGNLYLVAEFPRLFAAIGNLWGGDGTTNFAVPDFRRRVAVGSGGTPTSILANAVSSVGGAETYTQLIANMPTHNHPGSYSVLYTREAAGSGVQYAHYNDESQGSDNVPTVIQPQGSGTPHTIMQPSAVVQKLIRY